ncbi:MAG: hypothetical protein KJ649_01005 [Proteobacteria bacterium]|nr:hypothetical protein [Pseudomonadota bacterium]
MGTLSSMPKTLTEAQARAGYTVFVVGSYRNQSNSRFIPYSEIYQGRSSMIETPAQYLQKAVEEEKQRDGQKA